METERSAKPDQRREGSTSPALAQVEIQLVLRIAALAVLVIVAILGWRQRVHVAPRGPTPLQIDLNTASIQELTLLPGIGVTMAKRIVNDRLQRGHFGSVAELTRVRGIGERTLAQIEPYCVALPSETAGERVVVAKPPIE